MAEIAKMSADEQWAYQMSLKHKRDYYNREFTVREEGREIGLEQGREEGLEQGLEQGEDIKAQKVALKMLQNGGVPVSDIAAFIEKDVAFVENLKAKLDQGEL